MAGMNPVIYRVNTLYEVYMILGYAAEEHDMVYGDCIY